MALTICPLFSGSKGNATLVCGGNTAVLVDAGVSARRIDQALAALGVDPKTLAAVLVTHEHSDHIAGIPVFARKHGLRVYANAGTWRAMNARMSSLERTQKVIVEPDSDFFVGGLCVETYATPHDAACPQGYGFYSGGKRAAVVTDLGCMPKGLLERLSGCQAIVLECNHDEDMLRQGPYPLHLKNRILGRKGHLSNDSCGQVLRHLVHAGAQQIALAHISQENNTHHLARSTVEALLAADDIRDGRDIALMLGMQDSPGGVLQI